MEIKVSRTEVQPWNLIYLLLKSLHSKSCRPFKAGNSDICKKDKRPIRMERMSSAYKTSIDPNKCNKTHLPEHYRFEICNSSKFVYCLPRIVYFESKFIEI